MPDADLYCKRVQNALKYRRIHINDMTDEEREAWNKELQRAKWEDIWYMTIHYYVPIAFAILTAIYAIFKLVD